MKYIHSSELLTIPEGGEFFPPNPPVKFSKGSERVGVDSKGENEKLRLGSNRELLVWRGGNGDRTNLWDCRFNGVLMEIFFFSEFAVSVSIKSRVVTVTGPRGKLVKDLKHLSVSFVPKSPNTISIELHHGVRKNIAALRTVKTLIENLMTGVTRGYKYKMRYVYAHFPINVNIEENPQTGTPQVEIR